MNQGGVRTEKLWHNFQIDRVHRASFAGKNFTDRQNVKRKAVHRQFRKLTKTRGPFPNENSLLKLLYAGILNATEKWTMPI